MCTSSNGLLPKWARQETFYYFQTLGGSWWMWLSCEFHALCWDKAGAVEMLKMEPCIISDQHMRISVFQKCVFLQTLCVSSSTCYKGCGFDHVRPVNRTTYWGQRTSWCLLIFLRQKKQKPEPSVVWRHQRGKAKSLLEITRCSEPEWIIILCQQTVMAVFPRRLRWWSRWAKPIKEETYKKRRQTDVKAEPFNSSYTKPWINR